MCFAFKVVYSKNSLVPQWKTLGCPESDASVILKNTSKSKVIFFEIQIFLSNNMPSYGALGSHKSGVNVIFENDLLKWSSFFWPL